MIASHASYRTGDTIAAIATPLGEGGISIIRLSGPDALHHAERLFSRPLSQALSHTVHYGVISDLNGVRIDEILLLILKGPRSFTGEDTVEFHCHGGLMASQKILCQLQALGVRIAGPGEFTLRAFLNQKIDLSQAEAVQQLISAKNEQAFHHASTHLAGALSKRVSHFQKQLTHITAILEAWVDFPEEDLAFASQEALSNDLSYILQEMQRLYLTFEEGKRIKEGISLCILGPPNVGKSSLMNALLGKERAIVTPVAGTTRDFLEEELLFGGLHYRLIDTAGIRATEEMIEKIGIERSFGQMESADLVLLVFDVSRPLESSEEELLLRVPPHRTLIVWNKIDLEAPPPPSLPYPALCISVKENVGLEELKKAIQKILWSYGTPDKEEVVISSLRHKEALAEAIASGYSVLEGLKSGTSPEFLTFEMRQVLRALGRILGTDVTEEILSSIFSQFCIGK